MGINDRDNPVRDFRGRWDHNKKTKRKTKSKPTLVALLIIIILLLYGILA